MPRLRRLSGDDVIALLARFDFSVHSERESHVKLRRMTASGVTQSLTIPRHRELDLGTLRAILRQASRFVPQEDLRKDFYTDWSAQMKHRMASRWKSGPGNRQRAR